MTKILSRTAIQRMVGVAGGSSASAGGGTGGGGGGSVDLTGYATEEWVNENYLSIEFFSSLFKAYDSAATPNEIEPNDGDTTAITNIKAMFGFWTEQYLSALGLNSAGGDGGASSLEDLQDVNLSSPTNGQALVYNATSGKWENQTIGGGSTGTLSSVGLVMPAGFSVSPGTLTADGSFTVSFDTGYGLPLTEDVSKGVTAYNWGNHANAGYLTSSDLAGYATESWVGQEISDMATQTWVAAQGYWKDGSGNHPSTLAGYGITDALGNGTTFWGQTASNGAVSGNMTSVGSIASNGEIKTSSANAFRLSYGTYGTILRNDSDYFRILLTASGSADSGSWNALRPFAITLSSGLVSMQNGLHIENANQGNATISGFNALRIGNGVIMWDSTNNAFKILKYDGTSANIYATGGVSALGFANNQGTSMQINNLTVSEKIHFDNGVDDNTIYTYDSGMLYIEANEGVQFFADIYSNNELFMLGHDIKLGGGKLYFDNSKYLYISNMSLYFYDGTQHIKIT